ncbi:hypothetical protein ABZ926_12695 [Streptomyces litmocidini]|uniref:hypothetical protein n=1 Tax=Streptomyces litmocidini TaxID=67318 RepID=UPI0033EE7C0D
MAVEQGDDASPDDDGQTGESDEQIQERIDEEIAPQQDPTVRRNSIAAAREVTGTDPSAIDAAAVREQAGRLEQTLNLTPPEQEAFTESRPRDPLEQLTEVLEKLLLKKPAKTRYWKSHRFRQLVIPTMISGITALIAGLALYVSFRKEAEAVNGRPDPKQERELTENQKQIIRHQLRLWWSEPDAVFWGRVLKYCNDWSPSVQQMMFEMNTIADMSAPVVPTWTWKSSDQKFTMTMELATIFTKAAKPKKGATAAFAGSDETQADGAGASCWDLFFTALQEKRYDGFGTGEVALPRKIAADIAAHAFGYIYDLWAKDAEAQGPRQADQPVEESEESAVASGETR